MNDTGPLGTDNLAVRVLPLRRRPLTVLLEARDQHGLESSVQTVTAELTPCRCIPICAPARRFEQGGSMRGDLSREGSDPGFHLTRRLQATVPGMGYVSPCGLLASDVAMPRVAIHFRRLRSW